MFKLFKLSKSLRRYTGLLLILSHKCISNTTNPIAPFLQNIPRLQPLLLPLPLSSGAKHILSGLLQTVLLTVSLTPPLSLLKTNLNIKLKTILLKYKCAVKLALPKKRSDHCLGFLEVIWFRTDRSDRRGWSHQTFRQDWPYPRVFGLAMPERPISVEASGHTESIDL